MKILWPSEKRGAYKSKVLSPIINSYEQSALGMPHTVQGTEKRDFTEVTFTCGSCGSWRMENSLVRLQWRTVSVGDHHVCKFRVM